jgi:hypothetical protein
VIGFLAMFARGPVFDARPSASSVLSRKTTTTLAEQLRPLTAR